MLTCRIAGHRVRFRTEGARMLWACERGCGLEGAKEYPTPADAERYAEAFNRRDSQSVGKRPTLSTMPLWLVRRLRRGGN